MLKFLQSVVFLFFLSICFIQALNGQPIITSISPASGPVGTDVTISGTNFSATPANNIIFFGAVRASVISASTTQLTTTVPVGATYDLITIQVGGLIASSPEKFMVTFAGGAALNAASFASRVDFVTGSMPRHVVAGDLDGDGKADLVVANYNSNTISILRNTGTSGQINFAGKTDYTTGTDPYAVSIGDLDGDGKSDIVVANYVSNTISVFRNTSVAIGVISFASKIDITTGARPRSVSINDLNGDGKADLVSVNRNSNTVSLFRNTSTAGTISFANAVDINTMTEPMSVSVGDLDMDGKLDLAVAISGSSVVSIYRNTTTAQTLSYAPKIDFATGSDPYSVSMGDFDRDGKLDLAVVNYSSNSVSILRNTTLTSGAITYAAKVDFTTGIIPYFVAISDFDGDAKLDLAVVNYGNGGTGNTLSVFKNTSTGSGIIGFDSKLDFTTGIGPISTSIADSNNDGKPDLVVTNFGSNTVSIFRNTTLTMTSFVPNTGLKGTPVTITGTNFRETPNENIVRFGSATATVTASTNTSISAVVPSDAVTGQISVIAGGQTVISSSDFTVEEAPAIVSSVLPISYNKGEQLTASITVDDPTKISSVIFKRRGISEPLSSEIGTTVVPVGNKYEVSVPVTTLTDPIGQSYIFEIKDITQSILSGSSYTHAHVKYLNTSVEQVIPNLSFGNQAYNYQIVSIPMLLSNNNVTSVFDKLGSYNKTMWRLYDYASGDNREYPAFNSINAGKGYWLIVRNENVINPGEGTAVPVNDLNPFIMDLMPGWNLIGNPYNFRISWADVLAFNDNPVSVGQIQLFTEGTLKLGTTIDRYRGGFVYNSAETNIQLRIPTLRNTGIGGRTAEKKESVDLTDDQWTVELTMTDGILVNELGGFGMHPKATLKGKDAFDVVRLPFPDGLNFFELIFNHSEFGIGVNKDIVPTVDQFIWEFEVRTSSGSPLELQWTSEMNMGNRHLFLFNPATYEYVDMGTKNKYLIPKQTKKLKILYGEIEYVRAMLDNELPLLGTPYPNPASEVITIPIHISNNVKSDWVSVRVYNSLGVLIRSLAEGEFTAGGHFVNWHIKDPPGIYVVKMKAGIKEEITKVIVR